MSDALFNLAGRTALVTGATSGIGLALARGLAEAGASVVVNGRDGARVASTVSWVDGRPQLSYAEVRMTKWEPMVRSY